MPEMPEVETLRRSLEPHLVGRTITGARILVPKMLRGTDSRVDVFLQRIASRRLESLGRRGKHLIFTLDSGYHLLFHLKMRGQMLVVDADAPEEKYLAAAFRLENGRELRFHDMWTWGEMRLLTGEELQSHSALAAMGPEPLAEDWTPGILTQSLARRARTSLKAALLDQTVVAGVGNIYADESLFRASLQPTRLAGSLDGPEAARLWGEIRAVLSEAIGGGGTTSDNYVDADGQIGRYQPRVYDRGGQPCIHCGGLLTRTRVAGRGTVYCEVCQN